MSRNMEIDWTDTLEWTTLHLAVKYDVESLKVNTRILEFTEVSDDDFANKV